MHAKHIYTISIILLLVFSPLSQARTLKIATIAPDGTTWMKELRAGAKEIKQKTNGRVKIKFYPGGVMGNHKSVLRKMRVGQLHGGAFTAGNLTSFYPDIQIYSLPFIFRSYEEVDYVRARMDKLIIQGLEDNGVTVLGMSGGGFAYLMCKKPLLSIDDLKRLKVWAPEGDLITQTMFSSAGVSPVSLPLADVYTGLQTGLLDTVASSFTGAIAFQWHTKVKALTDAPLVYLLGLLVVDKKTFQKIKPADQAIAQEVMGAVFSRLEKLNRKDDESARKALIQHGMKFVTLSPVELKRWYGIAHDTMIKLEKQGIYSAEMRKKLQNYIEAYHIKARLNVKKQQ